jgi:hypothetical protein
MITSEIKAVLQEHESFRDRHESIRNCEQRRISLLHPCVGRGIQGA